MAVRSDVLDFYRTLPFHYHDMVAGHVDQLRRGNPLRECPPLMAALSPGTTRFDAGCGVGELVTAAAMYHGADAYGIDANPVAIERAREIAAAVGVDVRFDVAELPGKPDGRRYQVVTSIGVLHHTDDCLGGLEQLARERLAEGGTLVIGLYHAYGRQPLLDHFAALRQRGAGEEEQFAEFRRLAVGTRADGPNPTFVQSWFRDQVQHPHETQHTLAEILPVLRDNGLRLVSTSINGFAEPPRDWQDPDEWAAAERQLADESKEQLAAGRFAPGFFLFAARLTR